MPELLNFFWAESERAIFPWGPEELRDWEIFNWPGKGQFVPFSFLQSVPGRRKGTGQQDSGI